MTQRVRQKTRITQGATLASSSVKSPPIVPREQHADALEHQIVRHVHEKGGRPPRRNETEQARQVPLTKAADAHRRQHPQQNQSAALHRRREAPEIHRRKKRERYQHRHPRTTAHKQSQPLRIRVAPQKEAARKESQRQHAFVQTEWQERHPLPSIGSGGLCIRMAQNIASGKAGQNQHAHGSGRKALQQRAYQCQQNESTQKPQRHIAEAPVRPGRQPHLLKEKKRCRPAPVPRLNLGPVEHGHHRHDGESRPEEVRPEQASGSPDIEALSLSGAMRKVAAHQEKKENQAAIIEQIGKKRRTFHIAVTMPHNHAEGGVDAAEVNPLDALPGHGVSWGRRFRPRRPILRWPGACGGSGRGGRPARRAGSRGR